jgi:hypothetical protein
MNPLLEILPRFEFFIKSDAGCVKVKKGKSLMPEPFNQGSGNALGIPCKEAGHKSGTIRQSHQRRIEGRVRAPLGRGLGFETDGRAGRRLSFGETINGIVKKQVLDINVSPDSMRQMTASNAQPIAVSTYGAYGQLWIGQFHTGCHRQGPSMHRMKAIGIGEKGISACATDPRHSDNLVMRQPEVLDGIVETLVNSKIPATGAPGRQTLGSNVKDVRFLQFCHLGRKRSPWSFHGFPLKLCM